MHFPTPAELRAIPDMQERARVAGALAKAGRDAQPVRDDAIVELLRAGDMQAVEVGRLACVAKTQMVRYSKRARELEPA